MAVQGLGWVLFAASIASIIWLVIQVAAGFAYCVRCWALMTSSFFLSAELVRVSAGSLNLEISIWGLGCWTAKLALNLEGDVRALRVSTTKSLQMLMDCMSIPMDVGAVHCHGVLHVPPDPRHVILPPFQTAGGFCSACVFTL